MRKRLFEKVAIITIGVFILCSISYALNLSRVKTWSAAEILTAAALNAEIDNILDHDISNADIAAGAGIVASKIDFTTASAIGSTTPSTGAFSTLTASGATTLNGNNTIGNATGDALTFHPSAWTLSNAVTITGTWTDLGTVSTADINGGTVDGITSLTAGGALDIGAYGLTALTFTSDQTTGTAPFTVASTTEVANLKSATTTLADDSSLLDTYDTSTTAAANVIYRCGADNYMPDDTVDTTALKTAVGSSSGDLTTSNSVSITMNTYSFFPNIYTQESGDNELFLIGNTTNTDDQIGKFGFRNDTGGTLSYDVQWRYVTASGTDHWIFILIDKKTKDISQMWEQKDHPSYGNSEKISHPFGSYDESKHEIILLDKETCNKLEQESKEKGKGILRLIKEEYKLNMDKIEEYKPMHSGEWKDGHAKKVLIETIPDYIKVRKLTKLTDQDKQDKETRNEQKRQEQEEAKQAKQERISQLKQKLNLSDEEWELLK